MTRAAGRAAAAGEAEALERLLGQGARLGGVRSLLHEAAGAGHVEAGSELERR